MKFRNKGRLLDFDYRPRLAQIRKENNLKKKDMAEALGINYLYYCRVERGDLNNGSEANLSLPLLIKVAQMFEVDIIWLLTGHVEKPVKK